MDTSYYIHNQKYSDFLQTGAASNFGIFLNSIKKHLPPSGKFLDVGCGPGTVVNSLSESGIDATGIEISKSSLELAKKGNGKFKLYSGATIPFDSSSFDVVGSFDVIEHVEDVEAFLQESLRVLKTKGILIVGAPNFLSSTGSHHYRTAGLSRKVHNFFITLSKLLTLFDANQVRFDKFPPVTRPEFHPDDDATNLINAPDLIKWGIQHKLALIQFTGSVMPPGYPGYYLGHIPFLNFFTGGVFLVFQKP